MRPRSSRLARSFKRLALEGALDADLEFVEGARLRDVVERADADGLDRGVDRAVPGQHHDLARRMAIAQRLQHLQPADAGQLEVEQDDLRLGLRAHGQRLLAARGRADVVARARQLGRHHGPERRVIVHEQEQRPSVIMRS